MDPKSKEFREALKIAGSPAVNRIVAQVWNPLLGIRSPKRQELIRLLVEIGRGANGSTRRSLEEARSTARKIQLDANRLALAIGVPDAARQSARNRAYINEVEASLETAIKDIGLSGEKVKPTSKEQLQAEDDRLASHLASKKLQPGSENNLDELTRLLKNDDRELQFAAIRAIGRAGPSAGIAIPELVELLVVQDRDGYWDRELFLASEQSIKAVGPPDKRSVVALIALLKHDKSSVVANAIIRLGEVGPDAEDAVPKLQRLLQHDDYFIQKAAEKALIKIDPNKAVQSFIEHLDSPVWLTRFGAAHALGEMGPRAKKAIPRLIVLLDDNGDRIGAIPSAVIALSEIGADAVPALIDTLDNKNKSMVYYAISTLSRIGPPAKAAVDKLSKLKDHSEKEIRDAIPDALHSIEKK